MRLGIEGGVLGRLHEGLLRERTAEEGRHRIGDLVGRTAQPRVLVVTSLGQRRGGRLAERLANERHDRRFSRRGLAKLEEQRRVLVAREQTEEHPIGKLERP